MPYDNSMPKPSFQISSFSKHPRQQLYKLVQQTGETLYGILVSDFEFESKQIDSFGDYSTNIAFVYAPLVKKSPQVIAQELQTALEKNIPASIAHIEIAANGFLNFFITLHGWNLIAKNLSYPKPRKKFFREKIIIEFSSPNIAKPMSVGHLRATILGDALAKTYTHYGLKPVTWNHLGDWGTQFGKLLVAYKRWGDQKTIEKDPITELQKLYVEFHQKADKDASLEDEARKEFHKLETGDHQNRHIWRYIVDQSLKEFNRIYGMLRVTFDYIIGESFYESRLQPFIAWLKKKNIVQESQGALVIPLPDPSLPPALIQKSDGATLYLTRDLVSLKYRAQKIKPSRILYIVGNEQALHFQQLQEVNRIIHATNVPFEHIAFGLVLNALGKKFSTRTGDIITADEVLDQVTTRTREIQSKKTGQSLDNQEVIINTLATGVIKYGILKSNRMSTISFDFDSLFSLSGNSFPYLQYTYARIQSILKKASRRASFTQTEKLTPADTKLIHAISNFEHAVDTSIRARSLHHITDYLFALANTLNTLYEQSPILTDQNKKTKAARLYLINHTAHVIQYGLSLLGIEVQEKM